MTQFIPPEIWKRHAVLLGIHIGSTPIQMLHVDPWLSRLLRDLCTGRTCVNKQKQSHGWMEMYRCCEMINADAHWDVVSLAADRESQSALSTRRCKALKITQRGMVKRSHRSISYRDSTPFERITRHFLKSFNLRKSNTQFTITIVTYLHSFSHFTSSAWRRRCRPGSGWWLLKTLLWTMPHMQENTALTVRKIPWPHHS